MGRRSLVITTLLLLAIATYGLWSTHKRLNQPAPTEGHAVPFRMSDRIASLKVEGEGDQLRLRFGDGQKGTALTPGEFAAMVGTLQKKKERGGWLFKVLYITSMHAMFSVVLGFAGQFRFTGRMIVQWYASEKARRSIVPPAFWWMSLFGSSLLILYFAWRIDVVGVLGQATGWVVYLRSLWLLQKAVDAAGVAAKAGPA